MEHHQDIAHQACEQICIIYDEGKHLMPEVKQVILFVKWWMDYGVSEYLNTTCRTH